MGQTESQGLLAEVGLALERFPTRRNQVFSQAMPEDKLECEET